MVARRDEVERRRDILHRLRHDLMVARISAMNTGLSRLSQTDALTGLSNRRELDSEIAALWRAQPAPSIGLVMIDVDHFKSFNDTAGHAAGDHCLRLVAQALAGAVRRGDLAARYGGEEFAVVLRDISLESLWEKAEALRLAVADLQLPHPGQPGCFVSVSLGIALAEANFRQGGPETLLHAADSALYAAKKAGRNRVAEGALQEPAPVPVRQS